MCRGIADAAPEIENSFRLKVHGQKFPQITYASRQEKMPILSGEPDPLIQICSYSALRSNSGSRI